MSTCLRTRLSAFPATQSGSGVDVSDRLSSGFSRSGLSTRSGASGDSEHDDAYDLASPLIEEGADEEAELEAKADTGMEALDLSPDELEEPVTLTLTETDTITLLHIPGVKVQQDTPEHDTVSKQNEAYDEVCNTYRKGGGDIAGHRHTQTLNWAQKNKEVMAAPPPTRDAGVMATTWDIHDSFAAEDTTLAGEAADLEMAGPGKGKESKDDKAGMTDLERQVDEVVAAALASPGCLLDAEGMVQISSKNAPGGRKGRGGRPTVTTGGASRSKGGAASRSRTTGAMSQASHGSSGKHSVSRNSQTGSGSGGGGGGGAPGSAEGWGEAKEGRDVMVARESARVLSSRSLLMSLRTVERAIQQNAYHSKHRLYRAVPGAELDAESGAGGHDAESEGGADRMAAELGVGDSGALPDQRIEKLWSYHCDLTVGRNVSCIVWNQVNQDLLAVSYGQFDFTDQRDGLILFWSMKNPEYPECVLRTPSGVTTLDFSTAHPNLLAAGLYNGSVAIYDVRKAMAGETDGSPAVASSSLSGHTDAVWQVKWVDKGADRGERLVSISTDGRVAEWSMKKGLTCNDLMVLKRVRNPLAAPEEKSDGVISRVAAGLCIDFPSTDTSIYFAGTEDGVINKCSVSYSEQYLDSVAAHAAPVNKIRSSPYYPEVLLSCSADWTVKLWDFSSSTSKPPTQYATPEVTDAVSDVVWSPQNSTLFASVTCDGKVQVWDVSSLSPLVNVNVVYNKAEVAALANPPSRPGSSASGRGAGSAGAADAEERAKKLPRAGDKKCLSAVSFAHNAPVLVTGDSVGKVDVYRIVGIEETAQSLDEQVAKLQTAVSSLEM